MVFGYIIYSTILAKGYVILAMTKKLKKNVNFKV